MSKLLLTGGLVALTLSFSRNTCAQTASPQSNNWWEREVWSRLAYSGSRTIGYQSYRFEGDPDTFSSLTNYGTGLQHFTDIGNLTVQGNKVFGLLDFRATFTDNRFSDPEQQQYTLNYKRGLYDMSYGTIQASLLSGNRFLNFSRSLNGYVGDYKAKNLEAKLITSTVRGQARTVTIEGNNTSGPYYLSSGRIIGGSIRILLDGVELRQGDDFIVDVTVGSITFIGRVIPPTSTIIASYESFEIAGSGGTIQGAALAYNLGKLGKIGVTGQQQLVGGAPVSTTRIEQFQGFGNLGDQYALQFEPIPATIVVRVDGVVRPFSILDDGISEFFLSAAVPNIVISRVAVQSTKTIQIEYIPKIVQTVDGDRKVLGFDWTVPFGPKGNNSFLTFTQATGKLSGSTPSSGNARALDMRYNLGKSEFKLGLRKVDPGFRTIEQTGFNRNEDAAEFSYQYKTKGISALSSAGNSLISVNNGTTVTANRLSTVDLSLSYSDPKNAAKDITRTQILSFDSTKVRSTDDTRLTTLGYKDDFHHNKLTFGYGLENQKGRGKVDGDLTDIGIQSYRTSATYDAGKNWSVMASASRSNVNTDTIHSQGYDYSLSANMTQRGPWTFGAQYALSDSGVLASLGGFLNGNSLGFGNNGFGTSGGTGILSTGQLKARRAAINTTHQAGENLSLGLTFSNTTSEGSTTSNASIDALTFDAGWKINQIYTLNFAYSQVKSNFFVGSTGENTSNVFSGYFTGNPGKLWSFNLGYNFLTTTGSQVGQDSLALSFNASYQLAKRQKLFFDSSLSRTRGLYPHNDTSVQTGYSYSLTPGVSLIGRYSFRNLENLDPAAVGGAFRANGLGIELRFELSNRR